MLENIYFFASFGDLKGKPVGGGTTAARRLKMTLEKLGFKVWATNRHRPSSSYTILGIIRKYLWMLIDPILFFSKLLVRQRTNSTVLYMCYTGSVLPFDFLISSAATLAGHKKIMYLAGGKAKKSYEKGNSFYRWLFYKTVRQYNLIMTEGRISMSLINELCENKVKTFYLPNFTEDGFAPKEYPKKSMNIINMMFFGRINKVKNVLLIIDVFDELCKKHSNLHLLLVGSGEKNYEKEVEERIAKSLYKYKIDWIPWADHSTLKRLMKEQHFFIFPSAEPCEGHSNALNEAMSWGLIPIVSNNNYLPDVVGYPELIVNNYNVESYVKTIENLVNTSKIEYYSKLMYDRVKENFTQSIVEKNLHQELSKF